MRRWGIAVVLLMCCFCHTIQPEIIGTSAEPAANLEPPVRWIDFFEWRESFYSLSSEKSISNDSENNQLEETTSATPTETKPVEEIPTPVAPLPYSQEDLELMSHLIFAEAGSDSVSDEQQLLVGCVALNRVKSDQFPDTLREVIFQPGQYACTWDGNFEKEPNQRAIENAKKVLSGEYTCPETVLYAAEFHQGDGLYRQVGNTYFCFSYS